jgi:hypothetical protein
MASAQIHVSEPVHAAQEKARENDSIRAPPHAGSLSVPLFLVSDSNLLVAALTGGKDKTYPSTGILLASGSAVGKKSAKSSNMP